MFRKTSRDWQQGFTLVELMVAIAVLAVLVGLAMPSFQRFTAEQRVKAATSDLAASLNYARSEAIMRKATVTVAPLTGGWEKGWSVQVGSLNLRSDSQSGVVIPAAPTASLQFDKTGRLDADADQFEICDSQGTATKRTLKVSFSGRVSVTKGGDCE
ncbi:GspH/FimT family pseudopilin [Pseudomonas sp. GCM10022186]|uniref:GspH/FimT family pseudopilin n=1 Tax=Pseudomonas sp. GCM10022186 TaxID=3252650 RepID=UPI0036181CA9